MSLPTDVLDVAAHVLHCVTVHGLAVIPVGYGDCAVSGCCAPSAAHPWTYTVGLTELDHPELVLFGLHPHNAHHAFTALHEAIEDGELPPRDVPFVIDGVRVKLVAVPQDWIETDTARMAMWFSCYDDGSDRSRPEVLQLLWPDPEGVLPDEPGCAPDVILAQPLLAEDPYSVPVRPNRAARRGRHRRR